MKTPSLAFVINAFAVAAVVVGPALSFAGAGSVKAVSSLTLIKQAHLHALDVAAKGNVKSALQILQVEARKEMPSEEHDRIELSIGRLMYQSGDFEGALDAYAKVERGGPSWLESIEEQSWAEFRAGRPEKAIAKLRTVTSPAFGDRVGSEPYFLMALAQLRVCDQKALFKTLDLFKTRFRDRVKTWETANDSDARAHLKEVSETVQKMNLVEAEAIQRLYMEEDGKKHGSTPKIAKKSGQLTFPDTEGDEVWLDEVEDYHVSLRGCQTPAETNKGTARLVRYDKKESKQ